MRKKKEAGDHQPDYSEAMKTGSGKATKWIGTMNGGRGPKPGALRSELKIKGDKPIPKAKIKKAAKAKGVLGKRARLAETLEGFKKGKKK